MEELRSPDRTSRSPLCTPGRLRPMHGSISRSSSKKAGLTLGPSSEPRQGDSSGVSSLTPTSCRYPLRSRSNTPQAIDYSTAPNTPTSQGKRQRHPQSGSSPCQQKKQHTSARGIVVASASSNSPAANLPLVAVEPEHDPKSDLAVRFRSIPKHGTLLESDPPRLFAARRQRKHHLWLFVQLFPHPDFWYLSDKEFDNSNAAYAYCRRCKMTIAFAIGNHRVTDHMNHFHSREVAEYIRAHQLQRRLEGEFTEVADELRKIGAEEQKEFNRLLAKWIASHFRPLAMVEDKGFLEFVAFITETLGRVKVSIPKRTQLRGCIVTFASELRLQVRDDIEKCCLYFSITSDIWTARNARSYIAFTIHYVTENFEPRNWTLEVRELPGIHTGEVIAEALKGIMEEWGLRKEYCTRFVRDSGSNIVKAGKIMGIYHAPCMAHEIHLVLSGAMSKQKKASEVEKPLWASIVDDEPEVVENEYAIEDELNGDERADMEIIRDSAIDVMTDFITMTLVKLEKDGMEAMRGIVQTFRSLGVYFRKSSKGHDCLDDIQRAKLRVAKVVNLIVDCPTRWNSCWLMLQRCIRLEPAIDKFFEHLFSDEGRVEFKDMQNKLTKPKHMEWLAIKCLCVLLQPFASASTWLGGQVYPTLPLVMPIIDALEDVLNDRELFDGILNSAGKEAYVDETRVTMKDCQSVIKRLFDKRFVNLKSSDLDWIAFLDPRVACEMNHLTPENQIQARTDLLRAAAELFSAQTSSEATDIFSGKPLDRVTARMFGKKKRALNPLMNACDIEFKAYLASAASLDALANKDYNTFEWWRVNKGTYPILSKLARKWLGAVATSVPSERAFSTSGNIVTAKRSSLTPELVRDLVFIAENTHTKKPLSKNKDVGE